MPVTEALDRVLEILRTTELYSPQFGAKDDDPHANDLVGGLVSVSVLAGCRLGPAALACFLRLLVDSLPHTALFVCGVSQGLDHPLPRLSCPPAEPSPTCGLSGGGGGYGGTSTWNGGRSVFRTASLSAALGLHFYLRALQVVDLNKI